MPVADLAQEVPSMGLVIVCSCNRPTTAGRSRKHGIKLALTNRLPKCSNRRCGKALRLHPEDIIHQDLVTEVRRSLRKRGGR